MRNNRTRTTAVLPLYSLTLTCGVLALSAFSSVSAQIEADPILISKSGEAAAVTVNLRRGESWILQRSTNGTDWVPVLTNRFGGKTVTPVEMTDPVGFFRWTLEGEQIAPTSIRGWVIQFTLTSAVFPLNAEPFTLKAHPNGGSTLGYSGIGSFGSYRYGATGTNTARIEIFDTVRGRLVGNLTFTDRYLGTFEFNATGTDGWAKGTFLIQ